MAAPVSRVKTINACFYILDKEANASQAVSKPTIVLINPENGMPESEGPINVKQTLTPASEAYVNNWQAVSIKHTKTRRGLGVFATKDFKKMHRIIVEPPIITCAYRIPIDRNRTVAEEWCALSTETQLRLRARFRSLQYVPIGQDSLSWFWKKLLERFVLEYAFCNPQKSLAHIYVLGSHMNHACSRCANAEQWTESSFPHHIVVTLVKPVKAGDELFINYNRKQGPSFGCALCSPPGIMDRLDVLWGNISQWFSGFRTNEVAASKTTDSHLKSLEQSTPATLEEQRLR
ncbi:hypothetical protein ACHAQJ_006782 [Trichoderma viride]